MRLKRDGALEVGSGLVKLPHVALGHICLFQTEEQRDAGTVVACREEPYGIRQQVKALLWNPLDPDLRFGESNGNAALSLRELILVEPRDRCFECGRAGLTRALGQTRGVEVIDRDRELNGSLH